MLTYFVVEVPADINRDAVEAALRAWPSVEAVYGDGRGANAGGVSLVNYQDDPYFAAYNGLPGQHYLDPAPVGIDGEYAWTVPGGDGAGQSVVAIEGGAKLDHEDLVDHNAQALHGPMRPDSIPHGTAVIGRQSRAAISSENHRATGRGVDEFRGGATKLRFGRRNFVAKLPRNSVPGYGSASVFASVFTGRSPIFARIWRA